MGQRRPEPLAETAVLRGLSRPANALITVERIDRDHNLFRLGKWKREKEREVFFSGRRQDRGIIRKTCYLRQRFG
jgi:hypothetical protein